MGGGVVFHGAQAGAGRVVAVTEDGAAVVALSTQPVLMRVGGGGGAAGVQGGSGVATPS